MLYVVAILAIAAFAAVCLIAGLVHQAYARHTAELKAIRDVVEDIERRMITGTHVFDPGGLDDQRSWWSSDN
jgi:hypothetical protein